jgi:hypothetical protein
LSVWQRGGEWKSDDRREFEWSVKAIGKGRRRTAAEGGTA